MKPQFLIILGISIASCHPKNESSTSEPPPVIIENSAAQQLIDARLENRLITLDETLVPKSLAEGYAIQDTIIGDMLSPQVGWKVAITNKALMEKAGVKEPVSGPLFEK